MWKKLGLTLVIAALSVGAALAQDATPAPLPDAAGTSQVVGGDDATLRAFIIRYLGGGMNSGPVNVMIGQLPTDLPFSVVTPTDAVVYSTVSRFGPAQAATATYYDVTFDTEESVQALVDFYKQSFASPDWTVTSESVSPGQAFSGESNGYVSFCYQQGAATLSVNAYDPANKPTNVTMTVQLPGDPYACASQQNGIPDPLYTSIPSLGMPEGVRVLSNMGGGLSYYTPNGRSNTVSAVLESERPLLDIATDYNAQLAAAGWQQVSVENSERTALSTWTLTDSAGKSWDGSLLIVADNTPNLYNAVIYVEE